jgi:RNA polymerase sigma-70 factor (ECF subfamily)
MAMTTSLDLLRKVRSLSDGRAWEDFLSTYEPFIESWLARQGLDPHQAADVRQEVMCVLLSELQRFEHNGNTGAFRLWLRRITANRLTTYLRRQKSPYGTKMQRLEDAARELERDDSELASRWDREHHRFLIARLLTQIAPDFEAHTIAAFEQQIFEERSPDEVADSLQISKASVMTAKSRVLRRLKQHALSMGESV